MDVERKHTVGLNMPLPHKPSEQTALATLRFLTEFPEMSDHWWSLDPQFVI